MASTAYVGDEELGKSLAVLEVGQNGSLQLVLGSGDISVRGVLSLLDGLHDSVGQLAQVTGLGLGVNTDKTGIGI
jgi:hypothetical protein